MSNILFSNKDIIHTRSQTNRHNCQIWAEEQPKATSEWYSSMPKWMYGSASCRL